MSGLNDEFVCGFNVSEGAPMVLANRLFDCLDNFPADKISWKWDEMGPSVEAYTRVLGDFGIVVTIMNLAVIVGIARSPSLRKEVHNFQIMGQAFSDLWIGVLTVIFLVPPRFNGGFHPWGQTGCDIFSYGIVASCNTTVFSLAWIALNRKRQILENRKAPFKKVVLEYVFGVWGMTFVLMIYYPQVRIWLFLFFFLPFHKYTDLFLL